MSSTNKEKWEALDPDKRQKIVKLGVGGAAIALALVLYYGSGQDQKGPEPEPETMAIIDVGEARLEDDIRAEVSRDLQEQANRDVRQDQTITELKAKSEMYEAQAANLQLLLDQMASQGALGLPSAVNEEAGGSADWEAGITKPDSQLSSQDFDEPPPEPIELIGGVGKLEGIQVAEKKEKAGKSYYLPVSFMPARVLTGLRAKTVDGASEDPEPILLRVQAPAILPNDLRSDLEGCLVVAHGYGDLSSERVEARLVSMNCLDRTGKAVIEEEITGIVVDKDGVKGLAAHPVSKMGTNLARLAFANALEGIGAAFSEQAETTTISPLGSTQTIDTNQLGRAGAGAAASSVGEEYAEIISDLVRQQAPVLEMGPGKEVVIALTEGVWLKIGNSEK